MNRPRYHTSGLDTRLLTTNRITHRSDAHRINAHGPVQPMERPLFNWREVYRTVTFLGGCVVFTIMLISIIHGAR